MRKRWHELWALLTKEKKATGARHRRCSGASKTCASEDKQLDAGEGKGRSRQEGRWESGAPPLILCFTSRSRDLVYPTTGLNKNKKGYWKASDLLSFLPSKGGFSPFETSSWVPTAQNYCSAPAHRLFMSSPTDDVFLMLGHFCFACFS